jgi:DNA-binding transcriptional ArsR family regulator
MDITKVINDIQTSECIKCKFGKCMMALKDLRDLIEGEAAASVVNAPASSVREPDLPITKKPAAGKMKKNVQRAQGESRKAIMEYLSRQPGISAVEIADELGMNRTTVSWHLMLAKRAGQAISSGSGRHTVWSIAGNAAAPVTAEKKAAPSVVKPPSSNGDASRLFECETCSKRFILKSSLLEHMRIRHGAAA